MYIPKYQKFQDTVVLFEGYDNMTPVEIHLPDPPPIRKIANVGLDEFNRYFRRNELPPKFTTLAKKFKNEFIEKEWKRRIEGYWFFNGSKITYMTGLHYFYCNWMKLSFGYPKFRIADWEKALHWEKAVKDSTCYGLQDMGARQSGKCFAKNTRVRMYDGSIKMVQDIKDGDLVMGDDSTRRVVSGITSGKEEMFKIIPYAGEFFVCNKSHVLHLYCNRRKRGDKERPFSDGRTKAVKEQSYNNISVDRYLSLKSIHKHLVLRRAGWGNNFKEKKHYIPPYILGVFLGDGDTSDGDITNIEPEIKHELRCFCESVNLDFVENKKYYLCQLRKKTSGRKLSAIINGRSVEFESISDFKRAIGKRAISTLYATEIKKYKVSILDDSQQNPYRKELRRLNLLFNKHIPSEYMIDSEENRLKLLAGLLDTDGHLGIKKTKTQTNYSYEIIQKKKDLADQILELARSLGFNANMRPKMATLKRDGKPDYVCEVYRVCIYGDIYKIPCRVKRKQAKQTIKRNNPLHSGFKIKPVGVGEYYGFAVDGNNLFLLADGTVVHNSSWLTAVVLEPTSRSFDYWAGIQSKNDNDASDLFQKIVYAWRNLPYFFSPVFDGTTAPKDQLLFYAPAVKGQQAIQIQQGNVEKQKALNSRIDYRSSVDAAYDSTTLRMYIGDEEGKLEEGLNLDTRWGKVKPALAPNGDIVGKSFHTSTVELMNKTGGQQWKKMWEESALFDKDGNSKLNSLGQTQSGLWQHFTPYYKVFKPNKYGYSDENEARKYVEAMMKGKKDESKASIKRKYPLTVTDCFTSASEECKFDSDILDNRLEEFIWGNPYKTQGDFAWKNGVKDTVIEFHAHKHGKFFVTWLHDSPEHANKFTWEGGVKVPALSHKFIAGADPFAIDGAKKKGRSDGGFAVFRKRDWSTDKPTDVPFTEAEIDGKIKRTNVHKTELFCCTYSNRPASLDQYCEDVLMACVYYGCQVYPENNVEYMERYFKGRGYAGYLFFKQNERTGKFAEQAGERTTSSIQNQIYTLVYDHILRNGYREMHDEWLKDCREIGDDMNKFDRFVACGYALLGAQRMVEEPKTVYQLDNFVRSYVY